MNNTKISWTHIPGYVGVTSNPFVAYNKETGARGHFCVHASSGCLHCYSETMNVKQYPLGTGIAFKAQNADKVRIELNLDELERIEKSRKRLAIFWCDMTDLFLEQHTDAQIDRVFATIRKRPQDIHMILTKRAERARDYFKGLENYWAAPKEWNAPMQNVWLGVSCENQKAADERIPLLLETPAAVRFLSCEPLLGEIDFDTVPAFLEWTISGALGWVICGGESGPNFRPMNLEWARSLRDQCAEADTPYFYKQGNGIRSEMNTLLDGVEWHQFPDVVESYAHLATA